MTDRPDRDTPAPHPDAAPDRAAPDPATARPGAQAEPIPVLAAGIAHDVNNMITAVLSQLTLALDAERPVPECRALIREAILGSYRASELVQQLPALAAGCGDTRAPCDLSALLDEVARVTLPGFTVALEVDDAGHGRHAFASRIQVSQVLQNLLLNAAQAMPAGGTIHVRLRDVDVDGAPCVELVVLDDGEGIDAEHLPHVFDPHFTTKGRGSGLGLATSRTIVEAHEGTIRVESRPGEGSRFTIVLPAVAPA